MPSFDVVSEVDKHELSNAVDQANREVGQRFDFKGSGAAITDKSKFIWTMLIRQPDFVTAEVFETAKAALEKKKPDVDTSKARLVTITEGLCVQVMHIGSYDDELHTREQMDFLDNWIKENV